MKAKIVVTPKKAVFDPQGEAVKNALAQMGHDEIQAVHVGRYIELEMEGTPEEVQQRVEQACQRLLSNPVIEDYRFEIE